MKFCKFRKQSKNYWNSLNLIKYQSERRLDENSWGHVVVSNDWLFALRVYLSIIAVVCMWLLHVNLHFLTLCVSKKDIVTLKCGQRSLSRQFSCLVSFYRPRRRDQFLLMSGKQAKSLKVRFLHVERRVRGIILECNVLAHSNLKTEKFDTISTTNKSDVLSRDKSLSKARKSNEFFIRNNLSLQTSVSISRFTFWYSRKRKVTEGAMSISQLCLKCFNTQLEISCCVW